MNKKRKNIIDLNEISELRTYTLDGFEQKVLIEGRKKTNPIVIFLHGGPGSPIPFCEGCRGMFPELTERFIMVYWDQLGCGINNRIIDDTFSIDSFVNMTIDLVKQIKDEFKQNEINLFGVSWGSILAARTAEEIPELIHNVIVYGQVLKQLIFNDEIFKALFNSNMPKKNKDKLSAMNQASEHTSEDGKIIMKWVNKYTEGYQSKSGGKTPMGKMIGGLLTSPDYSFKDFKAMVINGYIKNTSLMKELIKIDLSETLQKITIPYYILQGNTDLVTPTKIISEFIKKSENNNLHYIPVNNSSHIPSAEGMNIIIDNIFELF